MTHRGSLATPNVLCDSVRREFDVSVHVEDV